MTIDELINIMIGWFRLVLMSETDIGICAFTNGSTTVTGTDFITNGVIQAGGYVKLETDPKVRFAKVASVDSETTLTLEEAYAGATSTADGVYSPDYIDIIRSTENAPRPSESKYLVIHKPFGQLKQGKGNYSDADDTGKVDICNRYEATIRIEEVFGFGDNLRTVINTSNRQDVLDYFRENEVSIMRIDTLAPNNDFEENLWEDRTIVDIFALFVDRSDYTPGYIETAEVTGTYNGTVN